jgi:hypothetical protein
VTHGGEGEGVVDVVDPLEGEGVGAEQQARVKAQETHPLEERTVNTINKNYHLCRCSDVRRRIPEATAKSEATTNSATKVFMAAIEEQRATFRVRMLMRGSGRNGCGPCCGLGLCGCSGVHHIPTISVLQPSEAIGAIYEPLAVGDGL